jgi:hypothetical protein
MNNPYVLFIDDTTEQLKNHSNRVLTIKVDKPTNTSDINYQKKQRVLLKKQLSVNHNKLAYVFHDVNKDYHYLYSLNNCLNIRYMKKIINYSKKRRIRYVFFDWDFTLSRLNGFYRQNTLENTLDVFTILYQLKLYKYDLIDDTMGILSQLVDVIDSYNDSPYVIIEMLINTKPIRHLLANIHPSHRITLSEYLEFIFGPKERIETMREMFDTFLRNNIQYFVLSYNGNVTHHNGKKFFSELLNHLLEYNYFTPKQIIDGYNGSNLHKSKTIDILIKNMDNKRYYKTQNITKNRLKRERNILFKKINHKTRKSKFRN